MYNSIQAVRGQGGVFGPGWVSILDQCLLVKPGCVEWVREDGRHIAFAVKAAPTAVLPTTNQLPNPAEEDEKPVEQWRAQGENLWLSRVSASQLPEFLRDPATSKWVWVISDNRGGRWVFTEGGAWVCSGSSQRDVVHTVREGDRVTAMETSWGHKITVSYGGARVVSAISSDGRCVRYSYDDENRLVQVDGPDGSRRYEWDDTLITTVVDACGNAECINSYDGRGRITSQQAANGRTVHFRYLPGGVTAASDADGTNANTWICDAHGRTTGVVDAHGGQVSMTYDSFGNMVRCVDRAGNVTSHRYDQRGRLTHTDLPTGGTIDCSWDDLDRLVSTTLANGAQTTFEYDGTERDPVRVTDPCGGVTVAEWKDGLLLRATNPVGVSLRFSYHHHAELVRVEDAHGEASRLIRDEAGRLVTTTCQDAGTSQTCHYDYDLAGELVSTVTQLGPGDSTVETHYRYDPCGRRIEAASSDGMREEFRWDSRGWLAGVMTFRAGRSHEFATHVDAFGCLTDVSGPAGRTPIAWDLATGEPQLVQVGGIPALPLPDGSVLTPVSADSDQDEPWRRPATDPLDPYTLIQEHLTAGISMTGGHLGVAGLAWMGARVYDSTTASFLTIDPLAAPPGSLWEAASYGYAATNPLALADPLGLRPVTDAQMRQFASTIDTRNLWGRHIRNVFSWETLGGVALATAGGLLMCFGAEVPGAMLIGAGGDMVFQQVVRGHVDYGEVALSEALAPTGGSGLSEIAGLGTRTLLTRGIEAGTTQGYVMGNYHWVTSPGPHNAETYLEQVGGETLSGAAFGGITATIGGKTYDALPDSIPTGHFGPHNTILRVGKQPETFIQKYQRNGKLDFGQATSFRGATFKSKIAIKPITTYRSWSDPDYEVGGYVSRTRPAGPLQTQLDLALAPQWGNKANHISEYEIPQFAPFYEGAAGVQPVKAIEDSDTLGQLPGGGNQILITDKQVLDRWKSKK
ncbi:DUF6531 domain-containing protein [Cutibacterium acnes]|uniref:DUF6531 domain-containing protein n=1 Tax=Cutibacterium acnes TaxID=1747 RepID=UPI002764433F|nr:DUF6531 domain-containing protein [Cutibacterium acnes]MDP8555530.1 DUF6531 domain-containing protein [Cutibacterium acnes]